MYDLTQYRGKRALLLGMPIGRTYPAWRKAATAAVKTLGLEYADEWFGSPDRATLVREAAHIGAALVLIAGRERIPQVAALGLPVLRVRRDGSVDEDSCA